MKKREQRLKILLIAFILSTSQIVFAQEPEAANKFLPNKVKLQATLTPPYVIGPGDQLTITDRTLREAFGQVEQYNVTVAADGYISIPLPDGTQESVLAAGFTLDELSKDIRELFGRTLKNPLLYVQINRYRPINIYIGGEIVKPGVYKIESGSTQEKGGSTTGVNTFGLSLTQAVQFAGGLKPRADIRSIVVTRGSRLEKITVDLLALLRDNDISQDINLQPGDTIFIPGTDEQENQAQNHISLLGKLAYQDVNVNVIGEVGGPGSFTLSNDSTIVDALGKAGGISDVGTLKKIKLSRYDEDGVYRTHYLGLRNLLLMGAAFDQIALRPNDTIEVEISKGKAAGKFFRDTGKLLIPLVVGATAQNFGQFIVQDNFFNRITRAGKSNLGSSAFPNNNSGSITIIGGQRVINEK